MSRSPTIEKKSEVFPMKKSEVLPRIVGGRGRELSAQREEERS